MVRYMRNERVLIKDAAVHGYIDMDFDDADEMAEFGVYIVHGDDGMWYTVWVGNLEPEVGACKH